MKHPLKFVNDRGKLLEAFGIAQDDPASLEIERLVAAAIAAKKNMIQLFQEIGELDISDELWANFLYTFGFWQGQQ